MKEVLVLGATGRTGSALIKHRPQNVRLYAGIRAGSSPQSRPHTGPGTEGSRVINLDDQRELISALQGVDVVVNAIRLRGEISPTALVDLHERIHAASDSNRNPTLIHVGGAGSLRLRNGRRFWQTPAFPEVTLPRGIAHAALRDHLEAQPSTCAWAYLIPPPDFRPDGPYTGQFLNSRPSNDEEWFVHQAISYEDFSSALSAAISEDWTGTYLVSH